jgi:hypothetical protein
MAIRKVSGAQFIQLFLQQVLPKRFVKIRHYGFLSTRSKKKSGFSQNEEGIKSRELSS